MYRPYSSHTFTVLSRGYIIMWQGLDDLSQFSQKKNTCWQFVYSLYLYGWPFLDMTGTDTAKHPTTHKKGISKEQQGQRILPRGDLFFFFRSNNNFFNAFVCPNSRQYMWHNWLYITLYHLKSFIDSVVPPIRLFLMVIMMPLKKCVAKKIIWSPS